MNTEKDRIIKAKKNLREFDYLYRKYFPKINNFVFHRVTDESVRNEIVSNVFFKAMKRLSLFRFLDSKRCSFSSWLYRIAVNEVNQYYRNRKRDEKIREMHKLNPEPISSNELNFEIVRKKIETFNLEEQNLIALRFFEKLSYKDIAEISKKKEGAVKVRIHRILNKLRESLKREIKNERS